MSDEENLQVLLERRPQGWVQESDFRLVEAQRPQIEEGQFLVRNQWLSLDPYMRGRISAAKSYAKGVEPGEVMVGETVGEVVESRHAGFKPGDIVRAPCGWQRYGVSDGTGAERIDDDRVPVSAYLGVLGMPGMTAHVGLFDIAQAKAGDTVVVSAASGAVGSVVGQLAKIHGCRAVGIAGGADKCRYLVEELGFDAAVDYKAGGIDEALRHAAPDGVDVYFDNVGGEVLDAVLLQMNTFSRIALCGLVSQTNLTEPYGVKNFRMLLTQRIRLQGFIVFDHAQRRPAIIKELRELVLAGRLKYRENVVEGLENAARGFVEMMKGRKLGKQLVKVV